MQFVAHIILFGSIVIPGQDSSPAVRLQGDAADFSRYESVLIFEVQVFEKLIRWDPIFPIACSQAAVRSG